MFAPDQYDEVQQGIYEPRGPKYELTIAAVVRLPEDIALDEGRSPISSAYRSPIGLLLSFGFWEQHHHDFLDFGQTYLLRLADGPAGLPALLRRQSARRPRGGEPPSVLPANADSQAGFVHHTGLARDHLVARARHRSRYRGGGDDGAAAADRATFP